MNWNITLSPSVRLPGGEMELAASVAGAVITVNGDPIDLSPLADGDALLAEAVDHPLVVGFIARTGDTISLTLILPIGNPAPVEACFPEPVMMSGDGPVPLPPTVMPPDEEPAP